MKSLLVNEPWCALVDRVDRGMNVQAVDLER